MHSKVMGYRMYDISMQLRFILMAGGKIMLNDKLLVYTNGKKVCGW